MLILFDQGTPVGIRRAFPDHTVRTAREQGWSALLNGELLRVAAIPAESARAKTGNCGSQQKQMEPGEALARPDR